MFEPGVETKLLEINIHWKPWVVIVLPLKTSNLSLAMSKFGMGLEEAKDCSSLADTNS